MSKVLGMENPGLKKRIAVHLEGLNGAGISMGEIISQMDLDKALAAEVSSALYKLRKEGCLRVSEGSATSGLGRRVVRLYGWLAEPVVVVGTPHPLNSLFLRRG
jgi:hypothetical protein